MWKPGGAKNQRPAEIPKHTVSKEFRKSRGLGALRDTEHVIKFTFAYIGRGFDFPHN